MDRGNLIVMFTNLMSLTRRSMWWKTLIDSFPSSVQSARQEALLYVFEDNEAVIKMILKWRSPTTRHVSRTHTVALDWFFDRINLDSKNHIKYIDTKNQLADILIKGNFTRDEWNHLLCLFNNNHLSSTVLWYNGEAISTRFKRRTSHSKITTDDESYCKGSLESLLKVGWWQSLVFSKVESWWIDGW